MKRWCCFCPLLQTSPFMNGWVGSKSMVFTIEPMGNTSQEIYNATLDMLLQQVYKARIENYVSNFTKSSSFTISFSIFQLHQPYPNFHPILCQITNKHCFDSWYFVPIVITIFLVNQIWSLATFTSQAAPKCEFKSQNYHILGDVGF